MWVKHSFGLGEDETALGHAWHVPNAPAVPLADFISGIFESAGQEVRVTYLPKAVTRALLPVAGSFIPPLRGLSENLYQTYEPVCSRRWCLQSRVWRPRDAFARGNREDARVVTRSLR